MKRTGQIDTCRLCKGTLTTWERGEVRQAYDEDTEVELWAEFERAGKKTEIRSAEELYRTLVAQGGDLATEVSRVAGPLAHVTAVLLGQGRAVIDPRLYEDLEKSQSLTLRDHLPRVEGHHFRFLLADLSQPRRPRLTEIAVDLRTGAILRQPL